MEEYFTFKVEVDDVGGPCFKTMHEFFSDLEKQQCWAISTMYLSHRQTPFTHSAGLVRGVGHVAAEAITFWTSVDMNAGMDEVRSENDDDEDGAGDEAEDPTPEDDEEDRKEELDPDATGQEEKVDNDGFDDDFLKLWDEVAGARKPKKSQDAEVTKDDPSSSSSSDSSSSSTTTKESMKEEIKKDNEERSETANEDENLKITRDLTNFTPFGEHHLTGRYTAGSLTGYAMACRHPGHFRCSKEMSANVAGSLQQARVALKAWIILGSTVADRNTHMNKEFRQILIDGLLAKSFLPEPELDDMMKNSSNANGQFESPFVTSSQDSKGKPSARGATLGQRGGEVPPALHERMCNLAAEGAIPTTTLDAEREEQTHLF